MKYFLLFIFFSLSHTTNRNILEDRHTIQKGINTSSDYDAVEISEIKYYENIPSVRKKPVFRSLYIIDDDTSDISQAVHPFNCIEISIQLIQNVNHNNFHDFYKPRNGIRTSITTPFYWGDVQASLQVLPFSNNGQSYADFTEIQPNLKWGKDIYLSDNITWFNSVGFGINIFYFSDKKILSTDEVLFFIEKTESEIGFSYSSRLSHSLNKNIHFNFEISNDIIFTYKKINLVNIGIGMSYSIKTPNWIKLILE